MTDLETYLVDAIRSAMNANAVSIFFDASRERTIAVVAYDDRTDVLMCDASSDDDDFVFYAVDPDLTAPACIPAVAIPCLDDDA